MPAFALLMLLIWPVVTAVIFSRMDHQRALVWTMLSGYLILPPLIEIDLHEQGNQFRRFVYVDAVLAGAGDDFFRDHSAAFGDDSWRCVGLAVGEGDCAL